MKRNTIIILGVIIVVIGIGFFFAGGGSKTADAPEQSLPVVVTGEETETPDTTAGTSDGESTSEQSSAEATPADSTQAAPKPTSSAPKPKPVTTTPPSSPYGALVTFTDTGFKPIRISIKEGQTVRFLNQSTEHEMWVASNIHPVHAGYLIKSTSDCLGSSFDQCKAVGTGQYWDFKFDAVGSWDYHNHVRPVEGGEITVEARE